MLKSAHHIASSQREEVEAALRASEERYRALVEDVPCGVFQSTPEGRFLFVNRALVDMLGYASEQELLAIDISRDLYERPEDRERIKEQLEAKGQLLNIETSFKCKDGRRLTVLANYRVVRDQHGALLYYEGTNTDISEQKRLEEQFRQAQKMEAIGRLASGVAHDFNNLLTAIFGYSDLVLDRVRDHPDIAVDIQEIKKAGERACRLTRQLLAFSRKQMLRPQVLDLNQVVGDLAKMLSHIIGEDIRLEMVAAPSLGHTKADPGQVEQLLMNLAVNARDAMPQGGTLTIATANVVLDSGFACRHVGSVPGRYVSLTVQDTGCGMTPEVLAHIFEPFFTTKGPDKGTGLGLSTVWGIVKQSAGYITVESTPGIGTTVTTYLPTVDDTVESAGARPRSVNTLKGRETILLVEDDTGIRDLIRKVLEGYGYTVLQAQDVGDAIAIEASHRGPIHLLVSDLIMPGLNGPDLAQRVVRHRPAIKVLYVSGFANQAGIDLGSISRSASFLQKPFTPEALATSVRECVDCQVGQTGRESPVPVRGLQS
ncbi:MAG: PAS domain S-box protein [Acidobacteria bacterium]|nr:PAS domain S-box protein [Acidobacteriota bacterium]